MRKWMKRIFAWLICLLIAAAGIRFGPNLYVRLFGNPNAQWISETYTETLREKNELVVYELETTGQETITQDAWLIGTVQKVELPYTFQLLYTVDLSQAAVTVEGSIIRVIIPAPEARYPKLVVDEANMRKVDWLYPLTPERYETMQRELENRLVEANASHPQYLSDAWDTAVRNLNALFAPLMEPGLLAVDYTLEIVQQS